MSWPASHARLHLWAEASTHHPASPAPPARSRHFRVLAPAFPPPRRRRAPPRCRAPRPARNCFQDRRCCCRSPRRPMPPTAFHSPHNWAARSNRNTRSHKMNTTGFSSGPDNPTRCSLANGADASHAGERGDRARRGDDAHGGTRDAPHAVQVRAPQRPAEPASPRATRARCFVRFSWRP